MNDHLLRSILHKILLPTTFILLIGVFLLLRWEVIRDRGAINPDEADLLAAGLNATRSLIPYETFTTSTYGPFAPVFLGVLGVFGFPLNLLSLHVLSAAFAGLICAVLVSALRKSLGLWLTLIAGGSFTWMFARGGMDDNGDFLHYSTELLPSTLLIVGGYLLFRWRRLNQWQAALVCCFAILASLAKYQLGLISLFLVGYTLFHFANGQEMRKSVRSAVGVLVLASMPMTAMAVGLLVSGNWQYFVDEGLGAVTNYVDSNMGYAERLWRALEISVLVEPWIWIPTALALLLQRKFKAMRSQRNGPDCWLSREYLPTHLLLIGLVSLAVSPRTYAHHLYVLLCTGVLGVVLVSRELQELRHSKDSLTNKTFVANGLRIPTTLVVVGSISLVFSTLDVDTFNSSNIALAEGFSISDESARIPTSIAGASTILESCPPGSEVFVFGWSAELYSFFDWSPTSRFTISSWFMPLYSRHENHQNTALSELSQRRPECVVDATGPAFFTYSKPQDSMFVNLKGIGRFLGERYEFRSAPFETNYGRQTLFFWDRID